MECPGAHSSPAAARLLLTWALTYLPGLQQEQEQRGPPRRGPESTHKRVSCLGVRGKTRADGSRPAVGRQRRLRLKDQRSHGTRRETRPAQSSCQGTDRAETRILDFNSWASFKKVSRGQGSQAPMWTTLSPFREEEAEVGTGNASCSIGARVRIQTYTVWLQIPGTPSRKAPSAQAALESRTVLGSCGGIRQAAGGTARVVGFLWPCRLTWPRAQTQACGPRPEALFLVLFNHTLLPPTSPIFKLAFLRSSS